jgi:hypothetical protein
LVIGKNKVKHVSPEKMHLLSQEVAAGNIGTNTGTANLITAFKFFTG